VNFFHRFSGVFIAILTLALWSGGCSGTRPGGSPLPVEPQGASGQAMITGIAVETLEEKVRITVQATEVVEYTAFMLHDPPRLVLTFPRTTLADLPRPLPVAGVVRSIEPSHVPRACRTRGGLSAVYDHACGRNTRPSGAGHPG